MFQKTSILYKKNISAATYSLYYFSSLTYWFILFILMCTWINDLFKVSQEWKYPNMYIAFDLQVYLSYPCNLNISCFIQRIRSFFPFLFLGWFKAILLPLLSKILIINYLLKVKQILNSSTKLLLNTSINACL